MLADPLLSSPNILPLTNLLYLYWTFWVSQYVTLPVLFLYLPFSSSSNLLIFNHQWILFFFFLASEVKICWNTVSERSCSCFWFLAPFGVLSRWTRHRTPQTTLTTTFILDATLTAEHLPLLITCIIWYLWPLVYHTFLSYPFMLLRLLNYCYNSAAICPSIIPCV
jgi:hypothetical protein